MRRSTRQQAIRRVGVVAASVLLAASCSTSVSSDTESSTTTSESSTTIAATTTAPDETITESDLEALLPTAAEVGPDYEVDTSDADDDDDGGISDEKYEAAMKKACPDLNELLSKFDDTMQIAYRGDSVDADRQYATDDARQVEVELDTDTESTPTKKQVDEIVAAADSCDTFEVSDSEIGGEVAVTLAMRAEDTFGDYGMAMQMRLKMSGSELPGPITIDAYFQMFQCGQVGVTVSATGGLDESTFSAVPPDLDVVKDLSSELDGKVADLLGN